MHRLVRACGRVLIEGFRSAISIGATLVAVSCGSSDSSDPGLDAASGAAGSSGGQPDGQVAGASGTLGGGGSSASGGSSAGDSSVGARCGESVCGAGSFCCGPQACGFCAPNNSGPFCGFECADAGTGGTGGRGGASGASGAGGSAGFVGSCDQISCSGATTCRCCPAGGPAQYCSCTSSCTSNADCRDPARPTCDVNGASGDGICRGASFTCCWNCF
jgi:hypothetical protein